MKHQILAIIFAVIGAITFSSSTSNAICLSSFANMCSLICGGERCNTYCCDSGGLPGVPGTDSTCGQTAPEGVTGCENGSAYAHTGSGNYNTTTTLSCSGDETCTSTTWDERVYGCDGTSVCDIRFSVLSGGFGCVPCPDDGNACTDNCSGAGICGFTNNAEGPFTCYSGPAGSDLYPLCNSGTATCSGGSLGACVGENLPQNEVCDASDNDCDGAVDEQCYVSIGTTGSAFGGVNIARDIDFLDADLDGDLDMAVAFETGGSSMNVYMNDGEGSFAPGYMSSTDSINSDEGAVSVGDCNGDGYPDLFLTANFGAAVGGFRVFENSAGAFNPPVLYNHTDASNQITDVVLGDVDGDNILDAVMLAYGGSFEIWSGRGDCTFNRIFNSGVFVPNAQRGALGDLSGDGKLELVIAANGTSYMLSGFVGNSWANTSAIPGIRDSRDVVMGDWDGDGELEFVLGNRNDWNQVYKPNSFSSIGTNDFFANPVNLFGDAGLQNTHGLAFGDYDGDGDLDVAECNLHYTNYRNRIMSENGQEWVSSSITPSYDCEFGDVDNDGDLDLVFATDSTDAIEVLLNEGGQFGQSPSQVHVARGSMKALAVGNWAGTADPMPEVAGSNGPGDAVWSARTSTLFTALRTTGTDVYQVAMADMNSDGRLDFVAAKNPGVVFYPNLGPAFDVTRVITSASPPKSFAIGDFNQDGPLDIVVAYDSSTVAHQLFRNLGGGTFAVPVPFDISVRTTHIIAAQIDESTLEPELIMNERPNGIRIVSSTTLSPLFSQPFTAMPGTFEVGDFDGDGHLDLLLLQMGSARFQIFPGIGDGSFDWVNPLWESAGMHRATSFAVSDINGDGHLDFAFGGDTEPSGYFINALHSNGDFALAWQDQLTAGGRDIALADADGDGDIDIFSTTGVSAESALWLNSGSYEQYGGAYKKLLPHTAPSIRFEYSPDYKAGYGSSAIVKINPTSLEFAFSLKGEDGSTVTRIEAWYSENGGGNWKLATLDQPLNRVAASPNRAHHTLIWKIGEDNLPATDNLILQLRAYVGKGGVAGAAHPLQRALVTTQTWPMRVWGPCAGVTCAVDHTCHEGYCFKDCANDGQCVGNGTNTSCHLPDGRCDDGGGDACANFTCPSGQSCYGGNCYDVCAGDGDCTPPNLCVNLHCVDPTDNPYDPLCQGVQCPVNDNCVGGTCFPGCTDSMMCGGTCFVDTCDPDDDDPCDDISCPTGQLCYEGGCIDPCAGSADCTPPQECYNSTFCGDPNDACAGVRCPAEDVCLGGTCFAICANDGDCTMPDVCFNMACRDPNDLCEGFQCPEGQSCHEGFCADNCATSATCGSGETCFSENLDCVTPSGFTKTWMGLINSQWALPTNWDPPGAPNNADAVFVCDVGATPNLAADVTVAELTVQNGAGVNKNGFALVVTGTYEENWCQTTSDACDGITCTSGYSCYEGTCFKDCADTGDCTPPLICIEDTNRCAQDACEGVSCPVDQVCYLGDCYDPCAQDRDCTFPSLCYANRCVADPCDGVDCEVGKICVGGSCYDGCAFNTDCPGYQGQGSVFTDVASGSGVLVSASKSAGAIFSDFNNDGCLDLMVNTSGHHSPNTIQLESDCVLPSPTFTQTSQCDRPHLYRRTRDRSAVSGDLNHDGWPDFVRNTDWLVQVYINDGAGDFPYNPNGSNSSCPATALTDWNPGGGHSIYSGTRSGNSINAEGVFLIDYDGDKDLDLFIEDEDDGVLVFRNDICSGAICGAPSTFSLTEISPASIGISTSNSQGDYCATADFDLDGDVDFVCRKDGTTVPDLYVNNGGTFTASGSFNQNARNSNKGGTAFCDLDNDGDFDLFWSDGGTNQIWEQTAPNVWVATGEPGLSAGLTLPNDIDGIACGDIDNDGRVDLLLSARDDDFLFRNGSVAGTWSFSHDNLGITGHQNGEAVVMADYDRNGSLDVFVNQRDSQLWKNPRTDNRYMIVRALVDLGGGVTRDAIGATMLFSDADGAILGTREVNGGKGHGSQDTAYVHYGLPYGANVPYSVTVTFPHGPSIEKCIVPSTISGYQLLEITDTDADDTIRCTSAGSWSSLIELPNRDGEFCYTDHCSGGPCEGIQCGSEFVCYGGNCKTACTVNLDCPVGEICDTGRCVNAVDPDCDDGSFSCPSNWECVAGECQPICATDSDCSPGEYCYNNLCVSDSCGSVACGPMESCYRGICFPDCAVDLDCSGGQRCYEGRCADNGCEALTDTYDANFLGRKLGKIVGVKQQSLPVSWARPIEGITDVSTYVNMSGIRSLNTDVPSPGRARVALYLDATDNSSAGNPDGRFYLWLQHGATVGQGPAQATYRVRLDNPAQDDPAIVLNDDAEGASILNSYEWIVQAQATSGANDTGGIVIGPIDASRNNYWTIRINAAFEGDIQAWEFYNSDGQMVGLDAREELTLALGDFTAGSELITPDTAMPCASPDTSNKGICNRGRGWCDAARSFRCTAAVSEWKYELCDGLDNDCDGVVDDNIVIPGASFRQSASDDWQTWLTVDESQPVAAFMNYTPYGTDDRSGGTDSSTASDGAFQAIDHNTVSLHRDLRTGELSVVTVNGKPTTGLAADAFGDYDAEMRMEFPDSRDIDGNLLNRNSTDEAFIAWYDDRAPGLEIEGSSASDLIPESETQSRFDLNWKVKKTGSGASAYRDSDAAAFRVAWSGINNQRAWTEGRLSWLKDNDDTYDDSDEFRWQIYAPKIGNTGLEKGKELHWQTQSNGINGSVCLAAAPTLAGCQLSRYQCTAGALSCGTANDRVCNQCGDSDGDGFTRYDIVLCPNGRDCNDNDPAFNPNAEEICDGYDNDCDTKVDIKDDDAYAAFWGEPRPPAAADCPTGSKCGPRECSYNLTCICPSGPGAANCRCGEGLEEAQMSIQESSASDPASSNDDAEIDDPQTTCASAANPTSSSSAIFAWLLVGLFWMRRRRTAA